MSVRIHPSQITWQKVENAVIFLAAVGGYFYGESNVLFFVLVLFSFDISMLGYLINKARGAFFYNLVHNYSGPLALLGLGYMNDAPLLTDIALLWFAHIGMDRMFGIGLKHPTGFEHTHLGDLSKNG